MYQENLATLIGTGFLLFQVQVAGDQPAFRALTSDDLENSFERFLRNQIV
jgi:hypothetical protein